MASSTRTTRQLPPVTKWVLLYLAAGVPVALFQPTTGQSTWYPPLAVGIVMLLTCGLQWWPLVGVLEVAVSTLQYRGDMGGASISMAITTLETVVAAMALNMLFFRVTLARLVDVFRLTAVGAAVSLVGASLGTILLDSIGFPVDHHFRVWQVWVVGDLTGIVIMAPALLLVVNRWRTVLPRLRLNSRSQRLEFTVSVLAALVSVTVYFTLIEPGRIGQEAAGALLLCLLPVVWISVRFGAARTSLVVVAVDILAAATYTGVGRRIGVTTPGRIDAVDLVSLQLPMLAIGIAVIAASVAIDAAASDREGLTAVLDASPVPIIVIDLDGSVRGWSKAAEHTFAFTADHAIGRPLPIVPPEGRAAFAERLAREQLGPVEARVEYVHRDGHTVVARLHTAPMRTVAGEVNAVLGILEDVTEKERLERRQAMLNEAIEQAGEALIITDPTGTILYANPAASSSSGYAPDELTGAKPSLFKSGLHEREFYEHMWATISAGRVWRGVIVNRRKGGELYEEDTTIAPVLGPAGDISAYAAIKRDLTVQRRLEADLQREVDDRALVMRVIDRVRSAGTLDQNADSLCAAIRDVLGCTLATVLMLQGDGALRAAGEPEPQVDELRRDVIPADRGAAELVTLSDRAPWSINWANESTLTEQWAPLLQTDHLTASAFAAIRWEGRVVGVLMIATNDPGGPSWVTSRLNVLGELASFAGVLVGSEAERKRLLQTRHSEIVKIIEERQFHIVFQPYVDLHTREVQGYEALTRFHDGTRPDRRIADAHLVGLGPDLECTLARSAIDAARGLPSDQSISINFSPDTVLGGMAEAVVADAGREVTIEITEHARVDDYSELRVALECCRGVKVSIDDAGAGFASLRHILELQPDVVKLDVGLIRGIDTDLARQALAAGLCHYADDTDTKLIAEGVETEAEADTVRRLGVHMGQGYLFGGPAPLTQG